MHAVVVKLSGLDAIDKSVPHKRCALQQRDAVGLIPIRIVETHIDPRRVPLRTVRSLCLFCMPWNLKGRAFPEATFGSLTSTMRSYKRSLYVEPNPQIVWHATGAVYAAIAFASRRIVSTVMSSSCPNAFAASAM